MVAQRQPTTFTEREYLALEIVAEQKHEFAGGLITAMAGAEFVHNRIAMNTALELSRVLGARCAMVGSDQRVRVEATREYFYPDVSAVCGEPSLVPPAPRSLTNPTLIVEVASPSTEDYDLGDKRIAYQRIPSLADYLVVASDRRHVRHFRRLGPDGWEERVVEPAGNVTLSSGQALTVAAFYSATI